jgi:hypothetical protein
MKGSLASIVSALLLSATSAVAQDITVGPGTLELTIVPGGATYFTSTDSNPNAPGFGNYTLGGVLTYNVTRVIGIEGEASGTIGIAQDLAIAGQTKNLRTPDTLNYGGNLVVSAVTSHGVVPYVTAGVGGLTVFGREELGLHDAQTFLTGNVGGGIKWYAANGRWGLRADYRFEAVGSKDDAPVFFGRDTRYGHRIYAGFVVTALR